MSDYRTGDARVSFLFLRKRVAPGDGADAFRYEMLKYLKIQHNVDVAGEATTYLLPISGIGFQGTSADNTGADLDWFPDAVAIEILDSVPSTVTDIR